jgi:hypothetical protein
VGGGGSELSSDYYMRRRGDQTIHSATKQEGFGTKQVACKDNGGLGYGILSRYVEFHYIYIYRKQSVHMKTNDSRFRNNALISVKVPFHICKGAF